MKDHQSPNELPKSLAQKLRAIQRRAFVLKLSEGVVRTLAALILGLLLAMLIDWTMGWLDVRVRVSFTLLVFGAAVIGCAVWCVRPLLQSRTIVSTARDVDETLPQLEERWSTVTELSENADAPEVRGSAAMIRKVAAEAESANAAISPETVVSAKPLLLARRWLIGAAALFLLFFAVNFSDATLLLQRFFLPTKNISLTQVSATPADTWVPKGEPLALNAAVTGRMPKEPPSLTVRMENGTEKTMVMTAKSGAPGTFLQSFDDVSHSFDYRVRARDGQTPWHRITAVDRPNISAVRLSISPPAYSKLPKQEKNALPHAVRVLQGSEIEIGFRCDQALQHMRLDLGNGQTRQLAGNNENWYQFQTTATESFTVVAVAINQFGLETRNKPSCRISVYEDLAPSIKVLEPSDDIAVLPGEKVNVTFEAADDFGLAKAEIVVSTTKASGETSTATISAPLEGKLGRKEIRETVQLDPKALGLKHGDQLSYVVQVTDTRQMVAQATAEANATAQNQAAPAEGEASNSSSPSEPTDPKSDQPLADSSRKDTNDNAADPKAATNESKDAQPSLNKPSSLAESEDAKPSDEKPNPGSQPPPNEMAMRELDAGQRSACKPRNILVDEWAGTFEGEKRKKVEIAIEPVLKRLQKLLEQAQGKTDSLKPPAGSAQGLQQSHEEPLNTAKGNLTESGQTVGELKTRTSNTPYAFIGLQLHNIGTAHVTPGHDSLTKVSIPATEQNGNVGHIDKASFHITRAREMLADLTKSYEKVKRDQQVADAMQKLNKMYQVFLENTQALLGSSEGPINSYQRKIAEVDDAYVEKLRELLEEKKKIMAELAKLLSEDPRLLRRFLAMQQLQCKSYRDQMTLVAERQQQVQSQIAKWNATQEPERSALLEPFRLAYAAQHRQVGQEAAKLQDNMETWLPLDVKPTDSKVQPALKKAEKIAQLINSSGTAALALDELRNLRDALPKLSEINSADKARMSAFIANRLTEVEALIITHSGHLQTMESLKGGDFPKVAEIVQHRITHDTATLAEKLDATEKQVARMSEEIADKAATLTKTVNVDILPPQQTGLTQLAGRDIKAAEGVLQPVVPAFAVAEQAFDELIRLIIAKLDEAPAPTDAGTAPDLQSMLTLLGDEMKACEGLGIPCRPINVAVMKDWMKPGASPGAGQGQGEAQAAQAQAEAAEAQAEKGKAETEKLEKQARESAQKALADARKAVPPDSTPAVARSRSESWNKLASRLQKDLLQGRDNTPPEQYREAIESYFKTISESATAAEK
ncbi:MAG: hypothetical protein ACR2OZ_11790 [Verrucomicrobiales bacterium]